MEAELMTIKEASLWASEFLGKSVSSSNISYLIQYGRIKKFGANGTTQIDKHDLLSYYSNYNGKRENDWKDKLGTDLNWALSFDYLREIDTTKHVHRLHPYKGKFIPQLVEYFLDAHVDDYKQEAFFHSGDIVLDPFCGSGTTLVQASEIGIHAIGVDVSAFNTWISNTKIVSINPMEILTEVKQISKALRLYLSDNNTLAFEARVLEELSKFNKMHFPVPEFKYKVKNGMINGDEWGAKREAEFLPIFHSLVEEYGIKLLQSNNSSFLGKWYSEHIRSEIDFVFDKIKAVQKLELKMVLSIILSRTMRSCRATTHADLATLKEPVNTTYYCAKHGKICKPLFSILKWWDFYAQDTINRLQQFSKLRTHSYQLCFTGDSRNINLEEKLIERHPKLAAEYSQKKIKGIFSSPPYVGLIDYHEQHAYAYDLFGFKRNDDLEIGPLFKGQGKDAKLSYTKGIVDVLTNCKRFLAEDYDVFLVANDKYNLYPTIASGAGMKIVNQYKRPVLNRTEKDKGAYSEIIFHLKSIEEI
ncbi:MAG: DNA methyltransferase [Candidatus Cloacimonetes bacterium]|nr:DNA methyltransferase [Candidatus Cloacimonadota bacterium]